MNIYIKDAKYLEDYKIEVEFNNGKKGIVNLENELYGAIFEPLKNKDIFSKLKVDKILETVVWENGVDFAPEFLYFKSFENEKDLENLFKEWGFV
jgi:hypothetical protein